MIKWLQSLSVGIGLTLGLLWMLTPHSNVEAAGGAVSGARGGISSPMRVNGPEYPGETSRLAPLLLAGGSTISGTLSSDDTWGPGVITVTGDITITGGTVITVVPGTQVQMATSDGLSSGVDPARIEWIIYGALRANGPVTFTSQSGTPAGGDWYGLLFLPGSVGWLDHAVVQYGVHGVVISTTNLITIADSTIRYNRDVPPVGVDAWGAGVAIFTGTHHVTNTQMYSNSLQASKSARAMGAGVYLVGGSTLFENCAVHDNQAASDGSDGFGGGLALWGGGAPTLRHCDVHHNTVAAYNRAFGGGVDIDDTDAVLEADTSVHDNTAAAITADAYGGGVSIGSSGRVPTPIIRNSRVTTNTCQVAANTCQTPAAYCSCYGGGVGFFDGSQTRAVISHSLIAANVNQPAPAVLSPTIACGGGIGMASGATADRFDGNVIRDNQAVSYNGGSLGGGVCLAFQAAASATNNLLFNNIATDQLLASGSGGGVFANGPDAYLANNTVVSNTAAYYGGGVYLSAGGLLSNTIVVSNSAGLDGGGVYWIGGSAGYNDVWGNTCTGTGPDYATGGSPRPPTDINADPLFAGSGDLTAAYHLRSGSPAIDKGTDIGLVPNQDYDDQPRPQGSHRDIGFDEVSSRVFLPVLLKNR
jgi:hypothetical protein